jgi:hypothetical protein
MNRLMTLWLPGAAAPDLDQLFERPQARRSCSVTASTAGKMRTCFGSRRATAGRQKGHSHFDLLRDVGASLASPATSSTPTSPPTSSMTTMLGTTKHTDLEMEPMSNFLQQVRVGNLRSYAIRPRQGWQSRRTSQLWMKQDCQGSIGQLGQVFGCPKGASKEVISKLSSPDGAKSACKDCGTWLGDFPAIADARRTCRPPEKRNRNVVADHQGGEYQRRVILSRRARC